MKKRIRPASGLKIKAAKYQLILLPCASLILLCLAFVFIPYVEASFRASATGSSTSAVDLGIVDAWARLTSSGDISMLADNPSPSGVIVSGSANVEVATNAPAGYNLYLSANDIDDGSSADLINEDVPGTRITPIASNALTTFDTLNTWGFAVKGRDSLAFKDGSGTTLFTDSYSGDLTTAHFKGAVSSAKASDGLIAASDAPRSDGVTTDVYYAAYVSAATPNGTYSTNVTYTLVADFATVITPTTPEESGEGGSTGESGGTYQLTRPVSEDSNYGGGTTTALGVNKTETDPIATVANINDGNITWAAIAIVAGASATFLAIALLRDREDEDEEE